MTIKQLAQTKGRVYVYLADEAIGQRFLEDLEREGFTFGDGVKPTARPMDRIYALNRNGTINYVGFVGHMAFGSGARTIGGQPLVRVDYREFLQQTS